jgi:hypothetical protein
MEHAISWRMVADEEKDSGNGIGDEIQIVVPTPPKDRVGSKRACYERSKSCQGTGCQKEKSSNNSTVLICDKFHQDEAVIEVVKRSALQCAHPLLDLSLTYLKLVCTAPATPMKTVPPRIVGMSFAFAQMIEPIMAKMHPPIMNHRRPNMSLNRPTRVSPTPPHSVLTMGMSAKLGSGPMSALIMEMVLTGKMYPTVVSKSGFHMSPL